MVSFEAKLLQVARLLWVQHTPEQQREIALAFYGAPTDPAIIEDVMIGLSAERLIGLVLAMDARLVISGTASDPRVGFEY
jgi:hypothetical protein